MRWAETRVEALKRAFYVANVEVSKAKNNRLVQIETQQQAIRWILRRSTLAYIVVVARAPRNLGAIGRGLAIS